MRNVVATAALALASCLGLACSDSNTGPVETDSLSPECQAITIDRFKELMVVEESIVTSDRSSNAKNGIWSFRHAMEEFTPAGGDPAQTAVRWFETWRSATKVNLFDVPSRPLVQSRALCNWLRATPANECDATCGVCKARTYDLANVPFRLIGIANRIDLIEHHDDPTTNGETRFLYALTDGPGDAPSSAPINMTIILEYRQPLAGRTRRQVAEAWHALGQHPAFDEAYASDLEALTRIVKQRNVEPSRPLGSAINQVRTNEREFEWQWDLREYELRSGYGLMPRGLENTPPESMNGTVELANFLRDNRDAVMGKKHALPLALEGGAAGILRPWTAPGVEAALVTAFSEETCNGCHQVRHTDFNFHVSPFRTGVARLSPFMHDPADPTRDELTRREGLMRRQLCGP